MVSGETLRKLRVLRGSSQQQMAAKLGISQPAYSKLEKRKFVNGKSLDRILKALLCTKEDIERIKTFTSPFNKN